MNEPNVEALAALFAAIQDEAIDPYHEEGWSPLDSNVIRWWARELAARGVLVVDALTDEEAEWFDTTDRVGGDDRARVVRQKLAQIAKGEDPSDYTPFQP